MLILTVSITNLEKQLDLIMGHNVDPGLENFISELLQELKVNGEATVTAVD